MKRSFGIILENNVGSGKSSKSGGSKKSGSKSAAVNDPKTDSENAQVIEDGHSSFENIYMSLFQRDTYYSNIVKRFIIGQDEAVDKLVYIVYHNIHENMMQDLKGISSQRYSAIVVGPSGCGKTASLTKIAELFHVPFVKYNATPITSSGYVGKNVEDMLKHLIHAANGEIEIAQRGILYIDEIDKKVSSHVNNTSGRDVNGTSVQEELLKFLEPSLIDLGDGILFDTSYLTVLMSGRFIGIDKIREKRLKGEAKFGFLDNQKQEQQKIPLSAEEDDYNEFLEASSPSYIHQDIINFGFLDEFVGRIFDVVEFKKLSKEDLVNVIFAEDSVLEKFFKEVVTKEMALLIDPANFERIAEAAHDSPMGARCIASLMNNFLIPAKRDFMVNYRPGVMQYDEDGNYSSLFSTKNPNKMVYNYVEGPRALRRKKLQKEAGINVEDETKSEDNEDSISDTEA